MTAPAHEITARSLMRRPSDGPNALPPTASVFRRGQSRRSIRCRIDRSDVGILCYCADSRGRKNRSGAAIAVPHRGFTHIVERSLWVAMGALRVVSSGFNRRPPGITRPQHPPTPRETAARGPDANPAHGRRLCRAHASEPDERSVGSILLRIASVPASHIYVRHLSQPGGRDPVVRLDDPVPADGRTVPAAGGRP